RFRVFDGAVLHEKTRVRAFDLGARVQHLEVPRFRPEIVVGEPIYDYGPERLLSLNHRTEGRSFYLFDALGSPVALTAADGSTRARYRLDAWGNTRSEAGSSWNRFSFTGYEKDESGLLYAKARFYDPELGRFDSEDPVDGLFANPPSLHKYLYAFDDPTVYTDPNGTCVFGLPCPKAVKHRWAAFKGYWIGLGKIVAAPGVLTYNLTGWALYKTTRGHQYRAQAEASQRLFEKVHEAIQSPRAAAKVAIEGITSGVQQMADAANRGDYQAFGEGLGSTVGQVALAHEAGSGLK